MSVALYMNHHVHDGITVALRERGVDVLTAQEDRRQELEDSLLLDRATQLNRILFSQDEDLLGIAALRQRSGAHFAGVIYTHPLRLSVGDCIRELEALTLAGEAADFANRVYHLPVK